MRKINKLTPRVIKRIIEEEKINVQKMIEEQSRQEQKKLLEMLRLLKKISLKENKNLQEKQVISHMKKKLVAKIKR